MEPAKIDWNNLDSVFIVDQVYENINAPQFVDFLSSTSPQPDDVAWFCRSDCKHPTTAQDFLKSTPTSKLLRSVSVSKLIDWTRREGTNLKRRGGVNQFSNQEDTENQNPNLSTPQNQIKHFNHDYKAVIKSSAEKDEYSEIMLKSDDKPRLNTTQSAKDLGIGLDFFGKITDFCNELKKMTGTIKETEHDSSVKPLVGVQDDHLLDKERKPLLQVRLESTNAKPKFRSNNNILRPQDAENIPVSLDINNIKGQQKISSIQMNPPTPQGFSATRDPIKGTPPKGPKSRLLKERQIFQELEQSKTLREELEERSDNGNASLVATPTPAPAPAKEGRALDVFWFLKPCTLSS
ncbi:hypothetical protein BVRB_2g029440 [Beta vulgaris subsp. vulgaris]|uniref:uncharacterized protein LOC104907959 n=1 Tax=Beta vulgaris subsp. vulgaris TaxID=3555 RepID=UPI00053F68E4|nr:uncharacterized protein LOC104907959 [Beta vulgaris subsp. vulgaris]KMT18839.1 hypothetical protein BVRB_2g029440 [Beta vulgaris subsp. vulgaris]